MKRHKKRFTCTIDVSLRNAIHVNFLDYPQREIEEQSGPTTNLQDGMRRNETREEDK